MHIAPVYCTEIVLTIYEEWYSHLPKSEMRKKNLINLIFAQTKAASVEQCHVREHDTNNFYTGRPYDGFQEITSRNVSNLVEALRDVTFS